MTDTIDVHDLPEEDIRFLEKIVSALRKKAKNVPGEKDDVAFKVWPLGVKGKLTRSEIYDYL